MRWRTAKAAEKMKNSGQLNSKPATRNVAIVAFPIKDPETSQFIGHIPLPAVLAPLVEVVFVVTGNLPVSFPYDNVRVINVPARTVSGQKESLFSGAFRVLTAQFTISAALLRLALKSKANIGSVIVFDPLTLLLPTLIARLLGRKVLSVLRGYAEEAWEARRDAFRRPLAWAKRINLALSHKIIIYHQGFVKEWNLERYRNKILVASYLFVDSDKFRPITPLAERATDIGYIGRLGREKGVLNLARAMPGLFEIRNDIKALIVGDGELRHEVEQYLREKNLENKVQFAGWVSNDDIPDYLNQLRLLVLPSYTEGLPVIVQEAMACGTPVLATPVGAIPDLIKDGETGFIMEDNSPDCIARNIIRALNSPNADKIARDARALAEKEFTYRAAVERYRDILAGLDPKR